MQVGGGRRLSGVLGLLQWDRLGGCGPGALAARSSPPRVPQPPRAVPEPERTRPWEEVSRRLCYPLIYSIYLYYIL